MTGITSTQITSTQIVQYIQYKNIFESDGNKTGYNIGTILKYK